ncbi:MAG: hypothetical protein OXE46_02545 [Chloroflexi bacterium]|nr:hypothetical protein [Chloroflexota bacterium]
MTLGKRQPIESRQRGGLFVAHEIRLAAGSLQNLSALVIGLSLASELRGESKESGKQRILLCFLAAA